MKPEIFLKPHAPQSNILAEEQHEGISANDFYQGDEKAHAKVKKLTMKIISNIGGKETFSQQDRQDIYQEVCEKVLNARDSFEEGRSFTAWVSRIVSNTAIDAMRKKGRRPFLISERYEQTYEESVDLVSWQENQDPSPEEVVIAKETAEIVHNALHSLPDTQREVIELSFFHGLSDREIAEIKNLPLGTVKTRKRLGQMKLRELLADQRDGT